MATRSDGVAEAELEHITRERSVLGLTMSLSRQPFVAFRSDNAVLACWVSGGPAVLGVEDDEGGFCDNSDLPGIDGDGVEQPEGDLEQGVRAFADGA